MAFITKTFYSQEDLVRHLKAHQPSFYFSSKTSTVIPYDKLEALLPWKNDGEYFLCDLSKIPAHMELKENGNLVLRGAVSWEEAKKFLRSKGRNLKTSPTEQLALITAGIATSCTGERCFAFGNMRSQVVRLKYLDFNGEEKELKRNEEFKSASPALAAYQNDFKHYQNFKNAPYPRFEKAIDLMIGTEGQLGIVTEVEIETTDNEAVTYVFTLLPRWEEDFKAHMEIFHAVQPHRDAIISCELLDANCMNYLKPDEKLGNNQDVIFLEVKSSAFEDIYANVLCNLTLTSADNVFEIAENKFHHVRAGVPRAIFEVNSQMGVVKIGTDVQVSPDKFEDLLMFYRKAAKIGVRYCLFGHFGDAHLHFNYMPTKDESAKCLEEIQKLYDEVLTWKGSPFAEHGIGLLKQKYIKRFHGKNQLDLFHDLKKEHDPYNQFFPQGFMNEGL
ncbi:FAD-linked oxidase C-terminal domain-containing protein [Peredibacter sp. HCB2-198]|uniref:FAD-linked oxidase C-terminal domain-containing protein n=1 Tax=Peredibacter sp. HCB2-198 TaxID=3383025 RepID=UPI0038B604DD